MLSFLSVPNTLTGLGYNDNKKTSSELSRFWFERVDKEKSSRDLSLDHGRLLLIQPFAQQ